MGVPIFKCFFGTLPERLFEDFGVQKDSKMDAFGGQFWGPFPKTRKPRFLIPLTRFRQLEGADLETCSTLFSRLFLRHLLGSLRRWILMILGSPLGSDGEPFGSEKTTFLRSDFEVVFGTLLAPIFR